MDKKKRYLVLFAVMLLVAVILAFTAVLVSSTIYDGRISAGITLHVILVTALVAVAAFCLYLYAKTVCGDAGITKQHYITLGSTVVSGFFFSLASGYHGRADILNEYYLYIYNSAKDAPSGFYKDVIDSDWFYWLPDIADQFAGTGTMWYLATAAAVAVTGYFAYKAFLSSGK